MSINSEYNLELGDVVRVKFIGLLWHYGVVIQCSTPFHEAIIRTVKLGHVSPFNQTIREFAKGEKIEIIPYQSKFQRYISAQNAITVRSFDYDLLTNNCEHFFRRSWG